MSIIEALAKMISMNWVINMTIAINTERKKGLKMDGVKKDT